MASSMRPGACLTITAGRGSIGSA